MQYLAYRRPIPWFPLLGFHVPAQYCSRAYSVSRSTFLVPSRADNWGIQGKVQWSPYQLGRELMCLIKNSAFRCVFH